MNLVIVESPTKAKTISKFLGKDYTIKASMGHVWDLPKSTLAVDVENGTFAPGFQLVEEKKQILADLKKFAKDADAIILATDPDREGEAIAAHIKEQIEVSDKKKAKNGRFQRVVFHEITKEAIEEAFKHPREVDKNLVDAQTARRVLDRLVGYKLSPLLWQKVRRGLSAGRVQSVALRLIVEREREIEKFKKEAYYTIGVVLKKGDEDMHVFFDLVAINNEKIESQETFSLYDGQYKITKTSIVTEERAKDIVADLKLKSFVVTDVTQKEAKRSPQAPYTTSTLQQDGSRRFGFSGKRTMSLAQKLYEEGYITYHRTDSVSMAISAVNAMRGYVEKTYGKDYIPEKPHFYTTKQKLAQEAHEAIRPTKITVSSEAVAADLGRDFAKLYDMIWKRAVASQMSDARIESTAVTVGTREQGNEKLRKGIGEIEKGDKEYLLKANGSVLIFDGFLKVNPQGLTDNRLPLFTANENLTRIEVIDEKHETPAPPRYNEASIIKTLEEKGIGRPSTYAMIIGTIQERQYIERQENRFVPTPVGTAVNDFLVINFSDIDDIPFTAEMEDQLDLIAQGDKAWVPMMREFYTPFAKKLEEVKKADRVKIEVEKTDQLCGKCGSVLVVRVGKFGKFLSCSTFPECDFKKPFMEETHITCPRDSGRVIIKRTKRGRRFYGCSNYPNCDFAAWRLEDIGRAALKPAGSKTKISKAKRGKKK